MNSYSYFRRRRKHIVYFLSFLMRVSRKNGTNSPLHLLLHSTCRKLVKIILESILILKLVAKNYTFHRNHFLYKVTKIQVKIDNRELEKINRISPLKFLYFCSLRWVLNEFRLTNINFWINVLSEHHQFQIFQTWNFHSHSSGNKHYRMS